MFALAGFAIAFLVSFKNEEPIKEYAMVDVGHAACQICISGKIETVEINKGGDPPMVVADKIINDLGKQGWSISATASYQYFTEYILNAPNLNYKNTNLYNK